MAFQQIPTRWNYVMMRAGIPPMHNSIIYVDAEFWGEMIVHPRLNSDMFILHFGRDIWNVGIL